MSFWPIICHNRVRSYEIVFISMRSKGAEFRGFWALPNGAQRVVAVFRNRFALTRVHRLGIPTFGGMFANRKCSYSEEMLTPRLDFSASARAGSSRSGVRPRQHQSGRYLWERAGAHRSRFDRADDRTRYLLGRFVFPESEDAPACVSKRFIRLDISSDVSLKLGQPVVAIPLGERGVLGAAMPEAAVNKDGYSVFGKNDVGSAASTEWCEIDAISEAGGMEQTTNSQFRSGVSSAVCAHGAARPITAGPRHGERLPRGHGRDVSIL